jgi:hypothetical protein
MGLARRPLNPCMQAGSYLLDNTDAVHRPHQGADGLDRYA